MRLSPLQKFILKFCFTSSAKIVSRGGFVKFYTTQAKTPKPSDVVSIITNSLESLIDKELMIGYGVRTSHKWYIKEVKLSPLGRRIGKKLLGEQVALPFKYPKSSKK